MSPAFGRDDRLVVCGLLAIEHLSSALTTGYGHVQIGKGPQAFPRAEYIRRLALVRSEMESRDVETLIVSQSADVTYLSGYTARSSYVPEALVVTLADEEPTFVLRRSDAPAAIHQTFMHRDKVVGYPEYLIANPDQDGWDAVVDFVRASGMGTQRVGIESGALTQGTVAKFHAGFAPASIVDCTSLVTWVRIVKSDLEIDMMRDCAAITDAAIGRAREVVGPGVREADAVAEIFSTLVKGVNDKPSTGLRTICFCASPRTGTSHITWTEDVLKVGSQVNLELGAERYMYVAPAMRTLSIGPPSERLRRVHEAEIAGLEAVLGMVSPGATCHDVWRTFNQTIRKFGITKESRCGYPVGIDWLEPTASFREGDMTELRPNMTFHLMLGNWMEEDFGYVLSETIRVTESGVEVLTGATRELAV